MKRLLYLVVIAFTFKVYAQSFPVRNGNLDYIVSEIYKKDLSITNLIEIRRDNSGLHWFQTLTEIFSFDGVNKKIYKFKSPAGTTIPFRINGFEILEDNSILAATENGIFIFDTGSESFIWIEEKFPSLKGLPIAVSCFYKGIEGKLIFISALGHGFYLLEWNTKQLTHIIIDSNTKASVPYEEAVHITMDRQGNVWGLTRDKKGIWNFNDKTGKILCSWKGELPYFSDKRFQDLASLNYSVMLILP